MISIRFLTRTYCVASERRTTGIISCAHARFGPRDVDEVENLLLL